MAQQISKSKPLYVVTDKTPKMLSENEAIYLKNYRATFNKNADNAGKEGGNLGFGTPNQANVKYALITLPAGNNMTVGVFECEETNEIYFANWNSNNLHGWYLIDGATLQPSIIKIDKNLDFSIDPAHKIAAHRVHVRVIYERTPDNERSIKEKFLIYTDGRKWQRQINVIAAISTNGFDATQFPYWALRGPHFDADEFIDLPTRPPVYGPIVTPITPSPSDAGKPNTIIDKSVQFSYRYIYTDNRITTSSPYSNPAAVASSPCNSTNNGLPRGYNVVLNVGSAMVERIQLFVRFCGGDWYLYDTIERFGPIDPALNGQYWLRTNDWAGYNYNASANTISYSFYNDRQTGIIDQDDFNRFQTDCPVLSIALCAAGDAILLADNLYDKDNLPNSELAKFELSLIDDDESNAVLQTRKISLYMYMAQNGRFNQFVWTNGGDTTYRFGGIASVSLANQEQLVFDTVTNDYFGLQLGSTQGFIAYLAGTGYYAVSKQYLVGSDGTMTEMDAINAQDNEQKNLVATLFQKGGYVVQRFDFTVPPGKYIARIARHNVASTANYQATSTYIMGMASKSKIHGYNGLASGDYLWDNSLLDTATKELRIDVCSADFDQWTQANKNIYFMFIPYVYDTGGLIPNKRWRFIEGYVWEDEITQIPVESLAYQRGPNGGELDYYRWGEATDHNGFFFVYMAKATAYKGEVIFMGSLNCNAAAQIGTTQIDKDSHSDRGYYPNENVSLKDNNGTYGPCNRILVQGSIVDPNTGLGYSGIAVTSTEGPTAYTDASGTFSLPLHQNYGNNRKGTLYINSPGVTCFLLPEAGTCFDPIPYDLTGIPCANCTERIYPTQINIKGTVNSQSIKGMKDGGSYPVAFHILDKAGRTTYEQKIGNLDIPTFMEKKGFVLSKIQIALNQVLNAGPDAAYLIFSRGSNQRLSRYLQWVGDKIDFLDKNGNVTLNGAGAIRARITIQSLLDYNTQNNFETTATWQFVKGQILRIYDDGNGNLFDPANGGLMDFPILGTDFNSTVEGTVAVTTTSGGTTTTTTTPINNPGNTIIIPFDKRLLALNGISSTNDGTTQNLNGCGFWIEIETPMDTSQVQSYCEILGTYPIIYGQLQPQTWVMDTFDTYYLNRAIHVSECTGKAILHPFASTAISDYFGQDCGSCGRLLIADPQAEQKWYPTDVIKSDELVNEGRVNGLGTFRASNRKQYKGQEMGGIVAMHAQNKLVTFVCELNWFVADYDNNLAQARKDGLIIANFTGELGEPDVKVRSKYGCDMRDTGTVVIDDIDGFIFFADDKNEAVVVMDYRTAYDVAGTNNKGYFSDKFAYVRQHNQALDPATRFYFWMDKIFGFDFKFKELHVSFRKRENISDSPQYFTNTERGKAISLSETFTYSLAASEWNQWQTFVPEIYGTLRKSLHGELMIAFAAGVPYLHNDKTVNNYNEFFGVSDSQVIEVVFKVPGTDSYRRQIDTPSKDLTFQAATIESAVVPYFIDKIGTNNPNTFSYVPIAWFKKKKNMWYASILRDMASYPDNQHPVLSMLTDGGGKISGEWCTVRFVRDLSQLNAYSEVDGFFMQYIGFEKSK